MTNQARAPKYYKRDFWGQENLKFSKVHFRLEKAARLINKLGAGREADLLDLGCGPAALQPLVTPNVHYHGIDIAIQEPAPNLLEADLLASPIRFHDQRFDLVLAQGVFEYLGDHQTEKFAEIAQLLKDRDSTFVVSYVNFDHRDREIYWPYSNVQSFDSFRNSLAGHFTIRRLFATSHNWNHHEPVKEPVRALNMHLNLNVPVISRKLAVEYFFLCSPR
jgi:cyclopropane fatty-acyl-phospholipid synthase-like methyltransferase